MAANSVKEAAPKSGINYYYKADWLTVVMSAVGVFAIVAFAIWFPLWLKKKYNL